MCAEEVGAPLSRPLLLMQHLYVCTSDLSQSSSTVLVMALICRAPPDGRPARCCGAVREDEASWLPSTLSVTTQNSR